ncbi:MAG: hypothetical protein NT065_04540 [Chlamydiae bacterium]|nr:hypothetical protein [Chlamydiota bacterium]
MKLIDRQKICSNCDGRVPIESEQCIYCGAGCSTPQEEVDASPISDYRSIQDSLTSPYPPPYSKESSQYMKNDKEKNKPKPLTRESPDNQLHVSLGKYNLSQGMANVDIDEKQPQKSSFSPLLFLLMGSNLLIIGLLQFFFSERGILRLEWDSTYWFIYCLIASPLIYLGLKKSKEDGQES